MAQQVSSHETTHTEACDEYNVFILLHVGHQSADGGTIGGGTIGGGSSGGGGVIE